MSNRMTTRAGSLLFGALALLTLSTPHRANAQLSAPPTGPVPAASQAAPAEQAKKQPNGIITSNWGDFFNITRLQARVTPDGRQSFTQATFLRFPSKVFVAQVYEHTPSFDKDPAVSYFEVNVGGPAHPDPYIGKLLGWVCRDQAGTGITNIVSCGGQYNLSEHQEMADFNKRNKFTSFIQFFPLRSNHELGSMDIVHYYSFSIYKSFYVRGYNNWFRDVNGRDYYRALQDFILPLDKSFDLFMRHTWQNRTDVQYGKKGSEAALGVRVNLSF